jgi:uncharacterized RDD family membrane protein YckC/DNA-binding HxlR family transcriptional regulator
MAEDQENVSKVLSVLAHPIRRQILRIICDKGETSFTDLMNTLNIDTGKLSFHMRSLKPFLDPTKSGKYKLNTAGEDAIRIIRDIASWAELTDLKRETAVLTPARLKNRIFAFLIDFYLMFTIAVLLLLETVISQVQANTIGVLLNLLFVSLGILWIYSTLFEGFKGQTLGKRALGLIVIRTDGMKVDYERSAIRNFGKVILPVDLVLGYMLKDPKYIRYFDKFAGTTVIELRTRHNKLPKNTNQQDQMQPLLQP